MRKSVPPDVLLLSCRMTGFRGLGRNLALREISRFKMHTLRVFRDLRVKNQIAQKDPKRSDDKSILFRRT